jgi:riboflavin kinase/FMN adenylyltransferase
VYGCVVLIDGKKNLAVANVGIRPTFGGAMPVLEAHLLDTTEANLYGRLVEVLFIERLRDEQKFSGIESLRGQIALDCAAARELLATHR